jgi:DNA-binding transcriptional MerR regulator
MAHKDSYRIGEVCQLTATQPYVLRFWESEFPQLRPDRNRSGQVVYSRRDVDLVLRIKQLLYDEECTLDAARRRLADEGGEPPAAPQASEPAAATPSAAEVHADEPRVGGSPESPAPDGVPRERYEDAIEEIEHLRFELREAQARARKGEAALRRSEEARGRLEERSERAASRLDALLRRLERVPESRS